MRIGIIQCNPVTGDCAGNAEKLFFFVEKAARDGAELCIAPELVLCGPNADDLLLRRSFVARCRSELETLAERLRAAGLPPILLGAPIANPVPQGKPLQNCAVLLQEGKVSVIGRKVLLPCFNELNDTRYFEPGVACGVLQFKGWRIAVTIAEDAWNNGGFWQEKRNFAVDPLAEFMDAGGADCIVNLTALPYAQGMPALHQRVLGWLAAHYRVPLLAANIVGGNDGVIYYGGSFAFSREGNLAARAPLFEEAATVVSLVDDQPAIVLKDMPVEEESWKAVVLGTRDFAAKCGFSKAVIGLSGGVDSALVACVAAEAFGPENVTCLLMPSPYSSAGSVDDALALAENLGLQTHTLPLEQVLEAYRNTFALAPDAFAQGLRGVTEENIQARIRGAMVMAYSNEHNAMVLNTGNKSEAAVGYCTLYGDQVGALAVIGDLYKKQVYALCRWLNGTRGKVIPDAILHKAPSAELRPGQKDSDSLPPYDILDGILGELLDNGKGLEEIVEAGYERKTVCDVLTMVQRAEFKRKQAPTALQLSASSFAAIWHMPIACRLNF